jgi:hypothetical protein
MSGDFQVWKVDDAFIRGHIAEAFIREKKQLLRC